MPFTPPTFFQRRHFRKRNSGNSSPISRLRQFLELSELPLLLPPGNVQRPSRRRLTNKTRRPSFAATTSFADLNLRPIKQPFQRSSRAHGNRYAVHLNTHGETRPIAHEDMPSRRSRTERWSPSADVRLWHLSDMARPLTISPQSAPKRTLTASRVAVIALQAV
jgi:hypothetical protein